MTRHRDGQRVRVAVVGAGRFGQHHATKLARLPGAHLVAVCDVDSARAAAVAAACGTVAVADHRNLVGDVDAVTIAVPTRAHYEVARFFLEHGVDVLVEKPITHEVRLADRLVRLARERGRVLQVGHLERFFAEMVGLERLVTRPLYIEAVRMMPFRPDTVGEVGVVLDLMIHDLDLVGALVRAPASRVDAVGAPVLSAHEDIANVRLCFADGCVANLTANRVGGRAERKIRIFQRDSYVSLDTLARRVVVGRRQVGRLPPLDFETVEYTDVDLLERELESFLDAVVERRDPRVGGEDGRRALALACRVVRSLERHATRARIRSPVGPPAAVPPTPAERLP